MVRLSYAISKVIIDEYGQHVFLKRLADPLWFQAFGCVLGFDWHSSGVTTVVTGVLKQSINAGVHGISIAGGKGKKSTETKNEIPKIAERNYNLSSAKIDNLLYASRMTAKVDSAAIQDGYSLYHHAILFDEDGNWTVVQQGMNPCTKMARRYHWISDNLKSFVSEPHSGIISENKNLNALNMTSVDSVENQKLCVELAKGDLHNLQSSAYKVIEMTKRPRTETNNATLDSWVETDGASNRCQSSIDKTESKCFAERYEMPRKLNWNVFRKIYDIRPQNYEQLISVP